MMGPTHIAGGCLAGAVMVPATSDVLGLGFTPGALAAGLGIAAIGSMLPDTDHPDSLISHGILPGRKTFGKLSKAIGWYLSLPPRILGHFERSVLSHRGGTHSATFMLGWALLCAPIYAITTLGIVFVVATILSVLTAVFPVLPTISVGAFANWLWVNTPSVMPLVIVSIFWGYFAHLVQDSLTQAPVPWLWPFSKKKFFFLPKNLRIKTDGHFEKVFVRPVTIVLAITFIVINVAIPLGTETYKKAQTQLPAPVHHLVHHPHRHS